jgi:tetraacyldisaccharide 4'-kinase
LNAVLGWLSSGSSYLFSYGYGYLAETKNYLYDSGYMNPVQVDRPVLSVGNLSMGGTGKTPVLDWLLKEAQKKSLSVSVISRNYKALSQGIHCVDIHQKKGAAFFGDEAFLLALKHPHLAVFTGPQKWKTALTAAEKVRSQMLMVDDGFQHRKLFRDFDLVLLDASIETEEYQLLPSGRLREGFQSLRRADCIFLTKVNDAKENTLQFLRSKIPEGVPCYEVEYYGQWLSPATQVDKVILLCGVARPESVKRSLIQVGVKDIVKEFCFPDHHPFCLEDLLEVESLSEQSGVKIAVTEKDWIKLIDITKSPHLYQVLGLNLQFRKPPEKIYEFFSKILQ